MPNSQPLGALLSMTLVALTIELDNEFECRMPHRTTVDSSAPGAKAGPWLTSLVMWVSCLRYLDDDAGISVGDLERRARMKTNLAGMRRWGYITVDANDIVRATPHGRRARDVWPPIFGIIRERWLALYGPAAIAELRSALGAIVEKLDPSLPDYLPILGYGLSTTEALGSPKAPLGDPPGVEAMPLPTLLSKALVTYALDFERRSKPSLAIAANTMRLIGDDGVRVRDLPRLSGVSKESLAVALGYLERRGYVTVTTQTVPRVKIVVPTERGKRAHAAYPKLVGAVEASWRERFGSNEVDRLHAALETIVRAPDGSRSPLFACIAPQPGTWRASLPVPDVLPHFPMVLHRGGFPDGS